MPIPVTCPHCGARFKVHDRFHGRRGTCPVADCRGTYTVGEPSRAQSPRPQSPPAPPGGNATSRAGGLWRGRGRTWIAAAALGLIAVVGTIAGTFRGGGDVVAGLSAAEDAESEAEVAAKRKQRHDRLETAFRQDVKPFLAKFCSDCHSGEFAEAGFDVDAYAHLADVEADRNKWNEAASLLGIAAMPPADHDPRPSKAEREPVLAWLDEALGVDCELVDDPGRVTIRRLNRNEYDNTIRDLVGVDFQPADDFPSDDVGYGFDNIGDVLSLPPLLLEKYLQAAERVTDAAIDADAFAPVKRTLANRALKSTRDGGFGSQGFTLASTGEVFAETEIPTSGEYRVKIEASADQAGDEKAKMELRVDGRAVKTFEIDGHRKVGDYETTLALEGGRRKLAARFVNDFYNPDAEDPKDRDRNLHVRAIHVERISEPDPNALPETHRRLVVVRPGNGRSVRDAALACLEPFARRAFRRPIREGEVDKYADLVEMVVEDGETFERGVQVGVQSVLVSPHFLFRIEADQNPDDPNADRDLGQFELATRLSYFLWSTMPDEELFQLAETGELDDPQVLERQVRRMLADPKSGQLVEHFGGQWLNLGQLEGHVPDPERFGKADEKLLADMRRETLAFFEWVMREDRSVLDFLNAKTTFVNERLAEHYGIDGVRGEEFRQVSLDGLPRSGVLTQASILTLTSNPTRTSPVKRGKWIMDNVLGTPPPEPPPNVPPLEEAAEANPDLSLRKQLELHRQDPVCRSCHEQMDALGFGFENFDAVGRYREKDGEFPVDSSGVLPSGAEFSGPVELIGVLDQQRDLFLKNLAGKMLTYALGRGLEYYDECAVNDVVAALKRDEHRFSRLVIEIVRSDPFTRRRGDGGQR